MTKKDNGINTAFVIGYIIVPILCVLITYFLTKNSAQEAIVNSLSSAFDYVDSGMSYEQALQEVYKKSNQDDLTIKELNQRVEEFQSESNSIPSFEFANAGLISDGEKIENSIDKSIVIIDNRNYYSENLLDYILKNRLSYNQIENIVYYNSSDNNVTSETKVNLFDTEVLYDGLCYGIYSPSESDTFSMGSQTYNEGFVMYDDHSLFGEGDGYTLFDLQGRYSKIAFNVGRTNEYEKQDVVLKVYLNGEYVEQYSLNAQSPPIYLEIDLNYANYLKLEITGGSRVKYGFADVILYY